MNIFGNKGENLVLTVFFSFKMGFFTNQVLFSSLNSLKYLL